MSSSQAPMPASTSHAATQILPYPLDEDIVSLHYEEDHRELIKELERHGRLLEVFPPQIHNPYPMGLTLSSFHLLKAVSEALHRGITALVKNYFLDERLHAGNLELSPRAVEILRAVEARPYNIGSWRPDYLFPADDVFSFRVCEINARFPFNAFYASHEKNKGLLSLPYLSNVAIMPVDELAQVPDTFRNVFDSHLPVGIIKDEAGGWDVRLFQESFNSGGKGGSGVDDSSNGGGGSCVCADDAPPPPPPPPPPNSVRSGSFPQSPTCSERF